MSVITEATEAINIANKVIERLGKQNREMLSALEYAETVLIILKSGSAELIEIEDVLPKVQQAIIHGKQL